MQLMLLTEREAAELLRYSAATLRNWRRQGWGPSFVRARRKILYSEAAIRDFLVTNTHQQGAGFRNNPTKAREDSPPSRGEHDS